MARQALGTDAIIGTDCGGSRHAAMTLAQTGADYVAFRAALSPEHGAPDETQREMVAWWSELFEVPCVAFGVTSLASAERLARNGADFVAVPDTFWRHSDNPSETFGRLLDAITVMEAGQS